jgi:hypothetical protein
VPTISSHQIWSWTNTHSPWSLQPGSLQYSGLQSGGEPRQHTRRGAYNPGAYTPGACNLEPPDLELDKYSLATGACSLGTNNLGADNTISKHQIWSWTNTRSPQGPGGPQSGGVQSRATRFGAGQILTRSRNKYRALHCSSVGVSRGSQQCRSSEVGVEVDRTICFGFSFWIPIQFCRSVTRLSEAELAELYVGEENDGKHPDGHGEPKARVGTSGWLWCAKLVVVAMLGGYSQRTHG